MNGLLIAAHGSRRKESNDEIFELAIEIENKSKNQFDVVKCAFLQFSEPSFIEQIDNLVQIGVLKIVVIPYFIAAGSHVLEDIPNLVKEAKIKYPKIEFKLTPHFGKFNGIKDFILSEINQIV